jgi:pilus assembly protein Flp/PilA
VELAVLLFALTAGALTIAASGWNHVTFVRQERVNMIRSFARAIVHLVWRPEFRSGLRREDGQTFVEYALLLAFIAVVALVAVQLLGTNVSSLFNQVANSF